MESIIEFIENNSSKIIDNIDLESIAVYCFLKEQFDKSNLNENHLFQFVYRSFYRLDNAGLTPEFKTEYFKIMEEIRRDNSYDYENILRRLYEYPNRKNQKSFQFSFVTKMLNTIDNKTAIYDSEVAKMFNFSRPYKKDFDFKLNTFLIQLNIIQDGYQRIINENLLQRTVDEFDRKFKNNSLDEMKKLDFIFWSAGKLKK